VAVLDCRPRRVPGGGHIGGLVANVPNETVDNFTYVRVDLRCVHIARLTAGALGPRHGHGAAGSRPLAAQ
jgi:hypothetical protein